MTVTIRAREGDRDWGGASLANIEAVATSAAACFPVFSSEAESVAITLLSMAREHPLTVQDANLPEGEATVLLTTQGHRWAQLTFQFAHEFCHVIADPKTLPWDEWLWIEEAICETASLCALRAMAKVWTIAPPYPNWRDYAVRLEEYAAGRIACPDHCRPQDVSFRDWLAGQLPLLRADAARQVLRREDNTIIAKELLPIFESEPSAWGTIQHLHTWERSPTGGLADFFDGWLMSCPAVYRSAVASIAELLSVDPAAT